MNSLQVIQAVCRKWLSVPDQTALDVSAVQELLDGINLAQAEVWRSLPPHYKRKAMSLDFYGPSEGTLDVEGYGSRAISGVIFPDVMDILTYLGEPLTYEGEPLLFNGDAVSENPRPYCRIDIAGDQPNTFDATVLRHPYLGNGSGVLNATLYHDAKLSPVMIERVLSPMIDRISGHPYLHVEHHPALRRTYRCRTWTMRRILHVGVMRTLIELTPGHQTVTVLSFDAMVSPTPFSLGSSQRPTDLPYDEEVAGYISALSGETLRAHKEFKRDDYSAAEVREIAAVARGQLRNIPGQVSIGPNYVGTPPGF